MISPGGSSEVSISGLHLQHTEFSSEVLGAVKSTMSDHTGDLFPAGSGRTLVDGRSGVVLLPMMIPALPLGQEMGGGGPPEPEMPSKFPAAAQNLKTPNSLP